MGMAIGDINEYAVSTWLFENKPIGEALDLIKAAGFGKVELWADRVHLDPRIQPDLTAILIKLRELNLHVHSMHAPFSDIAEGGISAEFMNSWRSLIAKTIDNCQKLSCHELVFHVVGRKTYNWRSGDESKIADFIGKLCISAKSAGVQILLENLADGKDPGEFRCSIANLSKYFGALDIGYCIDIGHAPLSGEDPFEAVDIAADRLMSVHVSNNDGMADCHSSPDDGVLDWPAIRRRMREIGYKGNFVLEVAGRENPESVFAQVRGLFGGIGK
jgi:sugar phosphate isomerase/epimerase